MSPTEIAASLNADTCTSGKIGAADVIGEPRGRELAVNRDERNPMRRQRATDPASERGIQQAILDLLTAERVFAIRLNTCTVMVEGKDGHKFPVRSHYGGAGVPDILAFLSSSGAVVGSTMRAQWVLWIEVKRPGKKQSPEQVSFEKRITGDGHCYLTASSTDDVLVMLKALRAVTQ